MGGGSPAELRAGLRHVRWIGGAPGAGKSTIARRLADDLGLRLYTVEPFSRFTGRVTAEEAPLMHAFMSMDMDERWLLRSPGIMFETFHGFHEEGFGLIVEDLLAMPADRPILAEGFKLLPRLVAPLLGSRHHAIWLLPTSEFRRRAFDARGSTWDIPNRTSDPERTLANLVARDDLFTEALTREVTALDLPMLEMDGSLDVAESTRRVARSLGLLDRNPRGVSADLRRRRRPDSP